MPKMKNLACPVSNCDELFYKHSKLRNHIFQSHQIKIVEENFTFEDESAFLDWKRETEDREYSTYIQETGTRPLKNGCLRRYYICHRSLKSKSKLDEFSRKRAMKAVGSNKTGKACPSGIIMSIDSFVHIKYFSTHLGHECELGRQPISEPVRTEIAAKLAVGVPVDKILDEVREHSEPQVLRRIDLIQRKDLHNIRRDYKLLGDMTGYTPEASYEDLDTKIEFGSSELSDEPMDELTDNEEDCKIKEILKCMLVLSKRSELDKYNKEILRIILRQGMDILTGSEPRTDPFSVGQVVGTQNIIPQKRRPLCRTVCKVENSDLT